MHKHTKLTPSTRKEIYGIWCHGRTSFQELGRSYHVDKNVIAKVVMRGKLGDFSVHDSTNHRFRTIEYGLKRLAKTEKRLLGLRRSKKQRYEKNIPGELLHGDTKRLPVIKSLPMRQRKREVLYVAIDDATRYLVADILPDKTMWSSSVFLEMSLLRLPFTVECHYSDNGGEYRGNREHAFMAACVRNGIMQKFTKPRHPWTNGKAERVIRTILTEWFRKSTFTSYDERRSSLYRFVDYYNHKRAHMGLNNLTPVQKLTSVLEQNGDNAC